MRGEVFEIEHLCTGALERSQQPALAAAGGAVHDHKGEAGRHNLQPVDDPPAVCAVAAFQGFRVPADLAQDMRHRARTLAAAPAVDERAPMALFAGEQRFHVARDILGHQRRAEFLGIERRELLVHRADLDALGVIEHRRGNGTGNMIFGVFRRRARIDQRIGLRLRDLVDA